MLLISHAATDLIGNGKAIINYYGIVNIKYALYLHSLNSRLGYCFPILPLALSRIINKPEVELSIPLLFLLL